MKLQSEKGGGRSRWSFETTGAVDRAVAALIVLIGLLVAHVLGLDVDALRVVSSFAP